MQCVEIIGMSNVGKSALLRLLAQPDVWVQEPVSYTHLRAHETVLDLVCRLLLEKKNQEV